MAKNTTVVAAGTEDTHDFCLDENGQIMMLSGLDAYAQIVNCNMRTILGEKQLDMASGLPYLQTIFADKSTIPIWVAEVQKMLESISFVKRVVTIDTSVEDGVLGYRSVIETDLGPLTQTGRVEAKTIRDKRLQRKEEEEAPAAYILSFNTGDGTPIAPMAVNPGTAVKLPTAVKDGYDFVGWYLDQAFAKPVTSFVMPEDNVVLYAKFDSYSKFEIDTSYLGGEEFKLRIYSGVSGGGDVTVYWGDGSRTTLHAQGMSQAMRDVKGGTIFSHKYGFVGKFVVRIGQECSSFKIGVGSGSGDVGTDEEYVQPSKNAVMNVLGWSNGILSAFRAFSKCKNVVTNAGSWSSSTTILDAVFEKSGITNIVDWPESAVDIKFAYQECSKLVGDIPSIPGTVTNCQSTFKDCIGISPTDGDTGSEEYFDEIMPSHVITKSNYVSGCSDEVRKLYTSDWGGTKAEAQSLDLED